MASVVLPGKLGEIRVPCHESEDGVSPAVLSLEIVPPASAVIVDRNHERLARS